MRGGLAGPGPHVLGHSSGAGSEPYFATTKSLGRTVADGTITLFDDPQLVKPTALVRGPNGTSWFLDARQPDAIGQVASEGVVTYHHSPTVAGPMSLARGPATRMWFYNGLTNSIGSIQS